MLYLRKSVQAWGTPEFEPVLKRELAEQAGELPLQQGLRYSSSVGNEPVTAVIHGVSEKAGIIHVRAGIFYQGLITGCSCADDPSPPGENNEYCEVLLEINKASTLAAVMLAEK